MSVNECALIYTEKWFKSQKLMVRQTPQGSCITKKDAAAFVDILRKAKPLRPEFNSFCEENFISPDARAYADFLRETRADKAIMKCRYHPYCDAMEYYTCTNEQLFLKLDNWAIEYTADIPSLAPDCLSVKGAAAYFNVSVKKMLVWAKEHRDVAMHINGRLLLPDTHMRELSDSWCTVKQLEPVVAAAIERIPKHFRSEARKSILENIKTAGFSWYVPEGTYPQQEKGRNYYIDNPNVQADIYNIAKTLCVIPLVSKKRELNLSTEELNKKASTGIISAELYEGNYYISAAEDTRLQKIVSEFAPLDSIITNLVAENEFQFRLRNTNHRIELISFLERNGYEDMLISDSEEPVGGGYFGYLVPVEVRQALEQKLFLWLACYNKRPEHIVELMLKHFSEQYPKTISSLRTFINDKKEESGISDSSIVDLLDIIFSSIDCELHELSEAEINNSIIEPNKNRTIVSCTLLAEYLYEAGVTRRQYRFSGTGYKQQCEAYGIIETASIVAACCNNEVWDSSQLISKAIENKRFADMWLYYSLHIYSTWRSTDYVRLPAPRLRYSPLETLGRIQSNNYPREAAKYVADFFVSMIHMAGKTPNKTKRYQNIPELPFYCPESCMEPFGVILSIAAAHYYLNDSSGTFVRVVTDVPTMRHFFGPEIVKACGGRCFSGRRMSKSFMQAVRYEAEEGEGYNAQIAYMMAATMRAHKGGYAKIPETTRIYLQDANFAGLTAAETARMMFERGTCSFFVAKLLEMCYGEQYTRLPEFKKTEAIKFFKITPYKTNQILACIHNAEDEAAEIIQTMIHAGNDPRTMLKNILSNSACGKGIGENCIWKACNSKCHEPDRLTCFGCKFEIRTKQMLVKLMSEMARLEEAADPVEKAKNQWLQDNIILPAAAEIVQELRKVLSDEDLSDYLEICIEVNREFGSSDQSTV